MKSEAAAAYRAAARPAASTPWRAARFCAIDLELTGLSATRDEIISYAAIPIEGGRVVMSGAVEGRVRPVGELHRTSIVVHGLRPRDLRDAPGLDAALDPLLAALAGAVPVVHFAEIERPFLKRALRRKGVRLRRPFVDTSVLGALWLSERDGAPPKRLALAELAARLALPSQRPHDAGGDALTTAQLFIALATHLDAIESQTVRRLTTASRRLSALRVYDTSRG
ncbi:MAG TPA: 3'-5' exonuclease [Solirubrobacteraceae bacterium]|nr:3'-5' exonuclease [Solirubrobacteraceae bacterium]